MCKTAAIKLNMMTLKVEKATNELMELLLGPELYKEFKVQSANNSSGRNSPEIPPPMSKRANTDDLELKPGILIKTRLEVDVCTCKCAHLAHSPGILLLYFCSLCIRSTG